MLETGQLTEVKVEDNANKPQYHFGPQDIQAVDMDFVRHGQAINHCGFMAMNPTWFIEFSVILLKIGV